MANHISETLHTNCEGWFSLIGPLCFYTSIILVCLKGLWLQKKIDLPKEFNSKWALESYSGRSLESIIGVKQKMVVEQRLYKMLLFEE